MSDIDLLPPGFQHMDEVLRRLGVYAVGLVQKNLTTGSWAPNAGLTTMLKGSSKPLVGRTGALNSSLNFRVEGQDTLVVGTKLPYAKLVHDGGEIRPKNSKFLAIPASRRVAGMLVDKTPRQLVDQLKAAGYSTWFQAGRGEGALIMAKAKTGQPFVLFILKRSVRVPARPFMNLDDAAKDILAAQFWSLVWK